MKSFGFRRHKAKADADTPLPVSEPQLKEVNAVTVNEPYTPTPLPAPTQVYSTPSTESFPNNMSQEPRKPSNPRVQKLKEKLGLLNDVSTSSEEEMPENQYPSSRLNRPPIREITTQDSDDNLETIQQQNSAPSAASDRVRFAPQTRTDVPAMRSTSNVSQQSQVPAFRSTSTTSTSSNPPSFRPEPIVEEIPQTTRHPRMPQVPPPAPPTTTQIPTAAATRTARASPRRKPMRSQAAIEREAVAAESSSGFDVGDLLIAAAGVAVAVGTLIKKNKSRQKREAGYEHHGMMSRVKDMMHLGHQHSEESEPSQTDSSYTESSDESSSGENLSLALTTPVSRALATPSSSSRYVSRRPSYNQVSSRRRERDWMSQLMNFDENFFMPRVALFDEVKAFRTNEGVMCYARRQCVISAGGW